MKRLINGGPEGGEEKKSSLLWMIKRTDTSSLESPVKVLIPRMEAAYREGGWNRNERQELSWK